MTSRRHPRREPPLYSDINNWNDGFEYISPDASPTSGRPPPYHAPPPPPEAVPSTRTAKYTPRAVQDDFDAVRSRAPPQGDHRRSRRHSPSPPRRRQRSRDRERAPRYHHADIEDPPGPRHKPPRSKTMPMRGPPTPETSASPPPRRRRARGYSASPPPDRRRHRSPDAPRRVQTMPDRGSPDRDRHHGRSRREGAAPTSAPKRPGLARSKTTAALGRNASGLLTNPRFQQAAAAALQAGGMAALKQWKAPGPWVGKKGGQVASAALGAAAIDAFRAGKGEAPAKGKDEGRKEAKRGGGGKDLGGMIGGLLVEQLNGKGRGRR